MPDSDPIRDEEISEEESQDFTPLDISEESRRVFSESMNYPISSLFDMERDGNLNLQPKFQRQFVWDAKKINRLIESVFLDFPIPVVYVAEEEDRKWTVIDGQQRLHSLFKFLKNDHTLKNLVVFTELNGKTWQQLSSDQQLKFKNSTLNIVKIKKESHKDIRFEIFERLNTGSAKLNDQEIRNCVFRGNYNELLKELAENEFFQYILNSPNLQVRMLDVELVLRFFAFYNKTYLKYKAPMKQFLNNEIGSNKQICPEKISELTAVFKKSVDLIRTIFGDMAFRRMTPGNENDPNGSYRATSFNQGLYDILMNGFTDYEKSQVIPYEEAIREELFLLMAHDQKFIDAISGTGTDSTDKVHTKFEIWRRSLKNLLGSPRTEPRGFSRELKYQLFQSNPICAICNQRIVLVDDAEVDHINFYCRGGATSPGNARLTHRYCNRHRGAKDTFETRSVESIQPETQKNQPFLQKSLPQVQSQTYPKYTDNSGKIDPIPHKIIPIISPRRVVESTIPQKEKTTRKRGGKQRTECFFPLLEYLINNNGTMVNEDADTVIKTWFGTSLNDLDYELLKDGKPRLKKTVDWAKTVMKANGWLTQEIQCEWKITDYGIGIYKELKENPKTVIKVSEEVIYFGEIPKKHINDN
jgi:hypothetical protein